MSEREPDDDGRTPLVGFEERMVVEVRNRFDGSWSHGFEIIEQLQSAGGERQLRLRRFSDGQVLPELFSADDVVINPASRPGPRRLTDDSDGGMSA